MLQQILTISPWLTLRTCLFRTVYFICANVLPPSIIFPFSSINSQIFAVNCETKSVCVWDCLGCHPLVCLFFDNIGWCKKYLHVEASFLLYLIWQWREVPFAMSFLIIESNIIFLRSVWYIFLEWNHKFLLALYGNIFCFALWYIDEYSFHFSSILYVKMLWISVVNNRNYNPGWRTNMWLRK